MQTTWFASTHRRSHFSCKPEFRQYLTLLFFGIWRPAVMNDIMYVPAGEKTQMMGRPKSYDQNWERAAFGCNGEFPILFETERWAEFRRKDWMLRGRQTAFHGITLGELVLMLNEGVWNIGLHHPPSQTSPPAVWLATSRAMAFESSRMARPQ